MNAMEEIVVALSDTENLGNPDKVFTDDTAHEMVRPITLVELTDNIKEEPRTHNYGYAP